MSTFEDGHGSNYITDVTDLHVSYIADALLSIIAPAHLNAMLLIDIISFILFLTKLYIVIMPIHKVNGGTCATLNNKTDRISITTIDLL